MTHHVPAQGRIRRRSSALFSTALKCGHTSMRACSSSLTTSLNLRRGAGTGFGGRVRRGLRAPGSNASRLIVGLVSPHREQRPRHTPCERHHGHLLAAPSGDRLRPRAEGFRPRIRGARHAPSGLHEQGLSLPETPSASLTSLRDPAIEVFRHAAPESGDASWHLRGQSR